MLCNKVSIHDPVYIPTIVILISLKKDEDLKHLLGTNCDDEAVRYDFTELSKVFLSGSGHRTLNYIYTYQRIL